MVFPLGAGALLGSAGAANLISGGSAILGALGARSANDDASDLAANQFTWSLKADSEKYRRAVSDLRLAGLNPILAVGGGVHGGSPGGGSTPNFKNEFEGVSSALALRAQDAQIDNIRADSKLKDAQSIASASDALLKTNSAKVAQVNSDLLSRNLPSANSKAWFDKTLIGRSTNAVGNFFRNLSPFTNSALSASRGMSLSFPTNGPSISPHD